MSTELSRAILIVDDEPGGREALEGLLLNQGYRLEFAASGQEALDLVAELLPDLILLDVMMPGMDGFQVCRHLRSNSLTAEIPVLLVTALDDRETRLEGISAGADDFISKPYDRSELRLRVKTIMRIGRYRRLLTERARFNSVVDQAVNGYVTVEDDGRISYANASARRFLNLGEPGGESWKDFFVTARRQYRLEPDCAWPDEDLRVRDRHYLVRPETPTAATFWLAVTLMDSPENASGERLLRLHDITDEIGVRRERHSFHRMVSHKLRTPLNGIVSTLEMIQEDIGDGPQAELLAIAITSAARLNDGVQEILAFAELSSQSTAEGTHCSLEQLPALLNRLQSEMEIRHLHVDIDPVLAGRSIVLSPLHLESVLREIFENAQKFHPKKNPTIRFAAGSGPVKNFAINIRDDGLNLAPDQISKVWIPYYQGEKHITGEVAGMGLGLSVVRSIIVSNSGDIRLRNNPDGPGLEIDIDLPFVQP